MKLGRSGRMLLFISIVSACAALSIAAGSATKTSGDASPWGFALANLDRTCKPCDDFYQFAMGGWMKANTIPAEYSTWGSFTVLRDKNLAGMRTILESAGNSKAAAGSNEQKIGDFYASCMDTAAIEAAGAKPLAADLSAVAAIQDRKGLDAEIARLHHESNNVAFGFGATPDFKNSSQMIAAARQGGLGMPDRDYYLRDDEKSKQLREGYLKHVAKMFELAGDTSDKAAAEAQTVMTLETSLAKASRTRVELRDPEKNYNKMSLAELKNLTPDWSWAGYMQAVGSPSVTEINIGQPDFFKELDHQLSATPLADWKVYLRWHVIHDAAPALSDAFVQENFEFYGKQLSGTKELQPRWKRCAQSANQNLGEALGEVYVQKYFPPEAKARAKEMVNNLIATLRSDIPTLSWMGPETKKQALA
ncbi:MAG TPA: M13 family metallopeptidase N-terminal domain-containing protein, partial [Candidatus Acidoferrum sp.]|nr:M13 family metallopeptidase N-terminal domain-containing protein [Candidatus Acidoferrum sp.]